MLWRRIIDIIARKGMHDESAMEQGGLLVQPLTIAQGVHLPSINLI